MRDAVIVRMTGQIGLSETVSRTVVAASVEDAMGEFGLLLRQEAEGRNKWCEVTKAELAGRCVVTRQIAPELEREGKSDG